MEVSPWLNDTSLPGTRSQRIRCNVPIPNDLPDIMKRALSMPAHVPSITVNCMGRIGENIVLVQRARSVNMMFSDRIRVQHVHEFRNDPNGGIEWRQWSELVFIRALPWTHGFLVKFLQNKTVEEVKGAEESFSKTLTDAVARLQSAIISTTFV